MSIYMNLLTTMIFKYGGYHLLVLENVGISGWTSIILYSNSNQYCR